MFDGSPMTAIAAAACLLLAGCGPSAPRASDIAVAGPCGADADLAAFPRNEVRRVECVPGAAGASDCRYERRIMAGELWSSWHPQRHRLRRLPARNSRGGRWCVDGDWGKSILEADPVPARPQ